MQTVLLGAPSFICQYSNRIECFYRKKKEKIRKMVQSFYQAIHPCFDKDQAALSSFISTLESEFITWFYQTSYEVQQVKSSFHFDIFLFKTGWVCLRECAACCLRNPQMLQVNVFEFEVAEKLIKVYLFLTKEKKLSFLFYLGRFVLLYISTKYKVE